MKLYYIWMIIWKWRGDAQFCGNILAFFWRDLWGIRDSNHVVMSSEFLKCQKKNMFNFFSKHEMKWIGSDVSSQTYFSYIVILPQNNLRKAVCVTFAGHVKGLCSLVSQPRTFLLNVWSLFILTQKLDFKYLGYFNVAQKLANLFVHSVLHYFILCVVHSLLSLISLYLALLFEMELWVRCLNKRNSACWLLCFMDTFLLGVPFATRQITKSDCDRWKLIVRCVSGVYGFSVILCIVTFLGKPLKRLMLS